MTLILILDGYFLLNYTELSPLMFADIEIAHDIDQNYDINDKLADSGRDEIFRRGSVSGFIPCQSHTD